MFRCSHTIFSQYGTSMCATQTHQLGHINICSLITTDLITRRYTILTILTKYNFSKHG
jgi:uncharacterized protein (DUF2237 family)